MKRKDPMELNSESLEIQKRIMLMDRTQRVDDDYFYVLMFITGVIVIKISKTGSFFIFSSDDSKNSQILCKVLKCI